LLSEETVGKESFNRFLPHAVALENDIQWIRRYADTCGEYGLSRPSWCKSESFDLSAKGNLERFLIMLLTKIKGLVGLDKKGRRH